MDKAGVAIVLLALAAGATTSAYGATRSDYQQAYQKATREHAQAISLDNAWTTTGVVLKQAKAAAARGDYGKAVRLSSRAYRLAKQAVAQEKQQQTAWQEAVPK